MIEQFATSVNKSYYAYKEQAGIDRALLRHNLKEKSLTNAE